MKFKSILVIFIFILGIFLVSRYISSEQQKTNLVSQKEFLSELKEGGVSEVRISKKDDFVKIKVNNATDKSWQISEKHNYIADQAKVKSLILKFASLNVLQFVSNDPESYAVFGIKDTSVSDGSTKISFIGKDGKEIVSIMLGVFRRNIAKEVRDLASSEYTGQYVRKLNDNNVYVLPEPLTIPAKPIDWLDTRMANILQSKLEKVVQYKLNVGSPEEIFKLVKVYEPEVPKTSQNKPKEVATPSLNPNESAKNDPTKSESSNNEEEKKKIAPSYYFQLVSEKLKEEVTSLTNTKLLQVSSGLENARFFDVDLQNSADFIFDYKTTYHLSNGLVYEVYSSPANSVVDEDSEEKYLVKISVYFDNQYKQSNIGKNSDKEIVPLSNAEEAKKISEEYQPWLFKLAAHQGTKYRYTLDSIK